MNRTEHLLFILAEECGEVAQPAGSTPAGQGAKESPYRYRFAGRVWEEAEFREHLRNMGDDEERIQNTLDAYRFNPEEDAAKKAVEEAERNRPRLSRDESFQRARKVRSDKFLDTQVRRTDGSIKTRREIVNERMEGGSLSVEQVPDNAEIRKLEKERDQLRATAPFGNENHPKTKRLAEVKRLLAEGPKEPSYRLTDKDGQTWIISKTEYDHANTLQAPSPSRADSRVSKTVEG